MEKLKVGFIGGLTNGKIVYDYLASNKFVDLCVALTYNDSSGMARHCELDGDLIRSNSANEFKDQFVDRNLDMLFVAGWSELLSAEILNAPKMGTYGFHPSKLPFNRGRSVVAWQIEDGVTSSGLTLFKYNEYPDGGDIVAIENYNIEENDYVDDVLDKLDFATNCLLKSYFPLIRQKLVKVRIQNLSEGNFRRLRNDNDSEINWDRNSQVIYNKIRAVARPYPMAFFLLNDERYYVNRSEIISFDIGKDEEPGTLVATLFDDSLIFKTKDGFIRLSEVLKK
jgi:methionyl-tRNA formyltransferase